MEMIFEAFENLSSTQIEDLFRLRQNVFIIEQQCFYKDIDGEDTKAHHLLIYKNKKLAAYLRLFPIGIKYSDEASIGRIVVEREFRGTGLGKTLIEKGIELCEGKSIRIEAQAELKSYYQEFGFTEDGEIYDLDG